MGVGLRDVGVSDAGERHALPVRAPAGRPRVRPAGPLQRVRMTVAYDGSSFFGFAGQPGFRTVAGTFQDAIELVVRHRVVVTGAGRTDQGVARPARW